MIRHANSKLSQIDVERILSKFRETRLSQKKIYEWAKTELGLDVSESTIKRIIKSELTKDSRYTPSHRVNADASEVTEIRRLYLLNVSVKEIVSRFPRLPYGTVYGIVKNATWKDDEYAAKLANFQHFATQKTTSRELVAEIRKQYLNGTPISHIAQARNMPANTVGAICRNHTFPDPEYAKALAAAKGDK